LCTQQDSCQAGICTGDDPVNCLPLTQCHQAGQCDPATGDCSDPLADDGTACDDGDLCTQVDSCQTGACSGADPLTCSPLSQCHLAGECNSATGDCSNPAKGDGTACDDSDLCTLNDSCQAGACLGASPVVCQALDSCHLAGACDQQTGECSDPLRDDGSECDDGNLCTKNNTCQAGVCSIGDPLNCDDGDPCTENDCDPQGGCVFVETDCPSTAGCGCSAYGGGGARAGWMLALGLGLAILIRRRKFSS
jgi:MYXO-CTERM domain-containing protein